jgi:DNA adenine methylase
MPTTYSPLRYPGGKSQLAPLLKSIVRDNHLDRGVYAEPFAGGAGLAFELLFSGSMFEIWLNDLDPCIYALWHSALHNSQELCELIMSTEVSIGEWHKQREILNQSNLCTNLVALGFATLFLNRTNRSGILKGGVIGGKDQTGNYKLDCRFNKLDLCRKIRLIASYKNAIKLHNLDAEDCLKLWDATLPSRSLINIDPPYYKQGQALYLNHYKAKDHLDLSQVIKSLHHKWILTYDDTPEIEALYQNLPQYRNELCYSAQVKRKSSELLFVSPKLLPLGRLAA